jgi:hypothetical protein
MNSFKFASLFLALALVPATLVSVANGSDETPVRVYTHGAFKPGSVTWSVRTQKIVVEPTVIVAPRVQPRLDPVTCYVRAVSFNANGGQVRICERPASTNKRQTSDLI